jgi:CRP/FNR family cyclic AMP-dependent transcriptional regulator
VLLSGRPAAPSSPDPHLPNLPSKPEPRLTPRLTHEEIAQTIGTSRETVTRLFADLKKQQIVQTEGSTFMIRDTAALREIAHHN